jgi:hypothetical protein
MGVKTMLGVRAMKYKSSRWVHAQLISLGEQMGSQSLGNAAFLLKTLHDLVVYSTVDARNPCKYQKK